MVKSQSNMFARGSAAYDWCEPNYFVSSIVAEFWNTVEFFNQVSILKDKPLLFIDLRCQIFSSLLFLHSY